MNTAMVRSPVDDAITGFKHDIPMVTTDALDGRPIVKTIDLVRGNSIRTRHLGRDIMAIFKHMVGGELSEYTKLMGETREQAIDRMAEQAVGLGANAVVGLRLTTSTVMDGASEILAYGTAVVVE